MSEESSKIVNESFYDMDLITDDEDSCLTTDQSSLMSNESLLPSKGNIDNDINDQDYRSEDSENILKKERFVYVEMKIDEPPTFFESQYMITDSTKKSPIEYSDDDDDDDDDGKNDDIVTAESGNEDEVFEKKIPSKGSGPKNLLSKKTERNTDEPGPSSRSSNKPGSKRSRKSRSDNKKRSGSESKRRTTTSGLSNWVKKVSKKCETKEENSINDGKENLENGFSGFNDRKITGILDDTGYIKKKIIRHLKVSNDDENYPTKTEKQSHVLTIAGVKVDLPVNPYPSQIAVMNKLIQGCKKEEHCLLESPTGSGKTLALLCGVLAWQDHMQDEVRQRNRESILKSRELFEKDCGFFEDNNKGGSEISNPSSSTELKDFHQSSSTINNCCKNVDESFDTEVCQPNKKICRSKSPYHDTAEIFDGSKNILKISDDNKTKKEPFIDEEIFSIDNFKDRNKVPKIYYGSRTHKQIEQVIRELNKTVYSSKRMTILSSRDFTCLQDTNQNKTELCTKLLDPTNGGGCRYYNEKSKNKISSHLALESHGLCGGWDIEDLVNIGRQESACPYFAAKDLMVDAEIIFCPYNYLIDPNIRDSMQIQLSGQVVILDEAHNIEEMSRDVGSLYFREDGIKAVIEEAESLRAIRNYDYDTYNLITVYLKSLLEFIKLSPLNVVDKFNDSSSSDFWTGGQLWELFKMNSLGVGCSKSFEKAAGAAIMDFNTAKEEIAKNRDTPPAQVISTTTKRFIEDLVLAIATIMPSEKLSNDYRACIVEEIVRTSNGQSSAAGGNNFQRKRLRTLKMLCMNPAVVFSQLANSARTIVLASGTLSPIHSFQSELGTVFPHKLDANHVVPKDNVYIRGVACGPTGVQLKANFANVNSWNFQDELGRLVLNVCTVIPHGVLCFFSSYSVMQKQIDRWRESSCWDEIEKYKHILQEPRGSSNLEPVMKQFRDIIQNTSDKSENRITGALLLAVFRGKVAEGIDFSDNEARCVMAIGIPYAVRMDPSVDMKFTYNNLNQSKGLLKGGEWYAVQAFRALNQALGRCLRHRNDWGAVLLVDQRFLERSNFNYLPKWVKSMWRSTVHYNLSRELREFVARQVEREKKEASNYSEAETSDT